MMNSVIVITICMASLFGTKGRWLGLNGGSFYGNMVHRTALCGTNMENTDPYSTALNVDGLHCYLCRLSLLPNGDINELLYWLISSVNDNNDAVLSLWLFHMHRSEISIGWCEARRADRARWAGWPDECQVSIGYLWLSVIFLSHFCHIYPNILIIPMTFCHISVIFIVLN